jgi:hypothetical protein
LQYHSTLLPVSNLPLFAKIDSAQTHIRQKVWDNSTGLVFQATFKKLFYKIEPDEKVCIIYNLFIYFISHYFD